jgi:S-adenosylmethionine-diacylglycerol 3-amino-3-carboxypropyl transferase
MSDIADRASFEIVRYANCWEDADVLLDALDPGPASRCLSIASAGDNSLALLARSPALVVAVDISPVQIACLELRRAAFIVLDHPGLLAFLGFAAGDDRVATYHALREHLSPPSRAYWDTRPETIRSGAIHDGKFERYFSLFRRRVLPLVHGRRDVAELLRPKREEERVAFYRERWDTWRWRGIFRLFFSRLVMGRMGRDPEFFRYVEGSVAERILARVEYALTRLPVHDNPYVNYILTGSFNDALPFYARPENHAAIRENIERLEIVRGDVGEAVRRYGARFDAWNLSDIFEYMDDAVFGEVASLILDASRPGSRLAYWNMLVPRSVSERFPGRARHLDELSRKLFLNDRAFFYQAFHIDEYTG